MNPKPKVYIDGREGTTGLQIYDRLSARDDLELLLIPAEDRKDPAARKAFLNAADLVFLCLPDAAAKEAVEMVENPAVRIIDASTAHRTAPGWDYGFPELSPARRAAIQASRRVANPGCHATGFIALVYPLIAAGVLPRDAVLSCFSLTGYSGGGRRMIAQYEAADRDPLLGSPAVYALGQDHKHLPEMRAVSGLDQAPVFSPIVADYYKGMTTVLPLSQLRGVSGPGDLLDVYRQHYGPWEPGRVVYVQEALPDTGKLYGGALAGLDGLRVGVAGNRERCAAFAVFDNLGKGASGAAVQNMNLMLGFPETKGLRLPTRREEA